MNAITLVHETAKKFIAKGDLCIDATAGRGYDTAFLCQLVGNEGKIIALDIQQCAIDSTKKLLEEKRLSAELFCVSHENIRQYASDDTVSCILFNLGYLPCGDHSINTKADSSITAISEGLKLLKKGGLMCVTLYYGGDSGYDERDKLLPWLKTLDDTKYQVLLTSFFNWTNDPPIPVFIIKN